MSKLDFLYHSEVDIRPADGKRGWMRPEMYRCLPMKIANSLGWSLHCKEKVRCFWDGGAGLSAIHLDGDYGSSHFGDGILTFHMGGIFVTDPGYALLVTGPMNDIRDGIHALSGIVETGWSHYSATMNWKFTRPFWPVIFEKGEPFCNVFPIQLEMLESVHPRLSSLEDSELAEPNERWSKRREGFLTNREPGWQKNYYRGEKADGSIAPEHRTKLKLQEFENVL